MRTQEKQVCVGDSCFTENCRRCIFSRPLCIVSIRFSCYSCRRWEGWEKLIALSYADVIFVQMHLQNNSFFSTSATADFHSDLFNMKSRRPSHRMQRRDPLLTGPDSCELEDSFIIVFVLQMDDTADRHAE